MDSFTESEMAEIMKLQADEGVQRLSTHFSWSEFNDQRRLFHQDFVYDAACFATEHGFTWGDVIRTAVSAKEIFPQLHDLDVTRLALLLKHVLCEAVPDLTPVQQCELARYLTDTLLVHRRLFQAVVGGATDQRVVQLQQEVQLPPVVCPLALGSDEQEYETLQKLLKLTLALQAKEEELKRLREGPRVSLTNSATREDNQGLQDVVHSALKATEEQTRDTLNQEASLLRDIQELQLQHQSLTTRGSSGSGSTTTPPHTDTDTAGSTQKQKKRKTKSGKSAAH
ncbi:uncharacterized protein C8orf74 homolog [Gouania willdenowi]|uniref:uncharacterized protein C8orf74 homolog n=1 Tax=Gouania willdenowi TaxID=441366 RepID=UPI0010551AD8|nr:uncharacterized protein C8orf74 homolog [Gouania willdenowi]